MPAVFGVAEITMFHGQPSAWLRSNLEQIRDAGERAGVLTRQLLAFSRKQILQPAVLDLNVIVRNIERMLGRLVSEDIEIVTAVQDELWNVKVDPGQIEQVIMNLVLNSRDAMPDGGTIVVETSNVELDGKYVDEHLGAAAGQYVMLAISDTGVGMDAETRAHLFEPFFTTKSQTKGTGLGLSTVYGIVKQSGGYISVYSELFLGTTFKIYLPRVTEAIDDIRRAAAEEPVGRGTETILLVEDEEMVRNLAKEILESYGYTVIEARDGIDAMLRCKELDQHIDLLVTDVIMPDMGGPELQSRLSRLLPGLKSLFMSGYTGDLVARQGLIDSHVTFLEKPFTPDLLLRKVRQALS
jgi:CheY-like chemotaxis protein